MLLTVGVAALAGRVKDGEAPVGEGEKLNFFNVEYIDQDEPCWIRVGEYHPVYNGFIPGLKQECDTKQITRGGATVRIYIDGVQLHNEIERSVVWRSDVSYPFGDFHPDEYDTKYTWYFVQFPASYFTPGVHEVIIEAYASNPNSYLYEIYDGGGITIEIVLHVAE